MIENALIVQIMLKISFHFILACPKYNDYRLRFLKKYYWEKPSMFKLLQLFNLENFKELCNVGRFFLS